MAQVSENAFTCNEEREFAHHLNLVCVFNEVPTETREELRSLFLKFRDAHRNLVLAETFEETALLLEDEANAMLHQRDDMIEAKKLAGRPVSPEFAKQFCSERRAMAEGYQSLADIVRSKGKRS